jgi:hypothetical protein
MHVPNSALLAIVAALGLLIAGTSSASAASYLHNGTTTGSLLSAGTALMSQSGGSASFSGDIRPWSCTTATIGATAGASGGATVTGTVDSITFSSCHTPGTTLYAITTCHTISPLPTVTFTATGEAGGTATLDGLWFKCGIVSFPSPYGCYYRAATAAGTYGNTSGTLTYSGVSLLHTAPSGATDDPGGLVCSNSGSFSMSFNDLVVSSSGTTVRLNTTS